MTDKQQIEDMARMMCGYNAQHFECNDCKKAIWECAYEKYAEALYNAGYRRVGESEMVVTKDEWEDLQGSDKAFDKLFVLFRVLIASLGVVRKETAKEIYITGKYYYAKHSPMERQLSDFLAHIKETYGVEVKE